MKNRNVAHHKQQIDGLFEKVKTLPVDSKIQSHWAKYLCVLVSGFLETSIYEIYSDYAEKQASPNVASYVEKRLARFQNAKMSKIIALTRDFNKEWANQLETDTEGDLKVSVDAIVAIRNQVAHGEFVGTTYIQIYDHYKNIIKVVELIENQCDS